MQHGHTLRDRQAQAADADAAALDGRAAQRQASVPALARCFRQARPGVLSHDLGLLSLTAKAHTHRLIAGSVLRRVVNEVGARTFDQMLIAVELQAARWQSNAVSGVRRS